jgi:hypothetical protein
LQKLRGKLETQCLSTNYVPAKTADRNEKVNRIVASIEDFEGIILTLLNKFA